MRNRQKELLLQLRSALVGKMHTQPFTIYSDATIETLLDSQPTSLEELAQVKGFPKEGKRVKGFGQSVVDIFTKYETIKGFAVDEVGKGRDAIVGGDVKEMSSF